MITTILYRTNRQSGGEPRTWICFIYAAKADVVIKLVSKIIDK